MGEGDESAIYLHLNPKIPYLKLRGINMRILIGVMAIGMLVGCSSESKVVTSETTSYCPATLVSKCGLKETICQYVQEDFFPALRSLDSTLKKGIPSKYLYQDESVGPEEISVGVEMPILTVQPGVLDQSNFPYTISDDCLTIDLGLDGRGGEKNLRVGGSTFWSIWAAEGADAKGECSQFNTYIDCVKLWQAMLPITIDWNADIIVVPIFPKNGGIAFQVQEKVKIDRAAYIVESEYRRPGGVNFDGNLIINDAKGRIEQGLSRELEILKNNSPYCVTQYMGFIPGKNGEKQVIVCKYDVSDSKLVECLASIGVVIPTVDPCSV